MKRLSLVLLAGLTVCLSAPASAQNAGSNVTGTHGFVAVDKFGNKIRFYDPVTLAETKVLDPPGQSAHELAISYDHKTAYVPLYGDGVYGANPHPNNKILVLDLTSQTIADVIDLGEYHAPHGIATTRDGKLWVTSESANAILLIDPAKKAIEAVYKSPGKGAHFLAMLPDESKIYLSSKEAAMAVFDTRTRTFRASIPMAKNGVAKGNGSGSEGLAPSPDGKWVIVADNANDDLRVIDTATDKEVRTVALKDKAFSNVKHSRLVKLMFSPDGKTLVATADSGGQAWVIDAAHLDRQIMAPVARGPQGMAFSPDGKSALVASSQNGLLTRIDLATGKPVAAYDGGVGIECLAWY